MLVLTRRIGQEIVINDDIRVKVLAISGHNIRLGFEAPPHVHIARCELLEGCYDEGEKRFSRSGGAMLLQR